MNNPSAEICLNKPIGMLGPTHKCDHASMHKKKVANCSKVPFYCLMLKLYVFFLAGKGLQLLVANHAEIECGAQFTLSCVKPCCMAFQ